MSINCFNYKINCFTCGNCNWFGYGDELKPTIFSEKLSLVDLNCPKCGHNIFNWIAPTINEVIEWKKNNNNSPTDWDNLI